MAEFKDPELAKRWGFKVEDTKPPKEDGDPAQLENDDDGEIPASAGDPVERNIPTTLEELEDMNLSEDDLESLKDHFGGELPDHLQKSGDDDGEGPGVEGDQTTGDDIIEASFKMSDEELGKLPKWAQKKVAGFNAMLDELGDYAKPEAREGLEILLEDPVVKDRMEFLKNGGADEPSNNLDDLLKQENFDKLNFRIDPRGAQEHLVRLLKEAARRGAGNTRAQYEQMGQQAAHRSALEKELDTIVAMSPKLKGTETDKYSNIQDFLAWTKTAGIDLVKVKGPAAYMAFKASTGKADEWANDTRKKPVANVRTARTMGPDNTKTTPKDQANKWGIDENRFIRDAQYRHELQTFKFRKDPEARAFMVNLGNKIR